MKLLTILILSSNRYELLETTISSLLETLTYPYWEMIIYNHDKTIGEGRAFLLNKIKGEYVLECEDDWLFLEKGNWVQDAIEILDNHPEVGMVRLRKKGDGQTNVRYLEKIKRGFITGGHWTHNPHIIRRSTLLKLRKDAGDFQSMECERRFSVAFKGFKTAVLN